MLLDPLLVLAVVITIGIMAVRLMWIGLHNGHDEETTTSSEGPTLNTRSADPDDPTSGAH